MLQRPRLALYQPDMPTNTGAIMRLCACFDVGLDIIEPCGFVFDDRKLKRVAMDYIDRLNLTRHPSWDAFARGLGQRRLVLLTTKTDLSYAQFAYRPDDVLLAGRESAGVPDEVHNRADARVTIPLGDGLRSLNVGMAAAIVLSEALRQTDPRHEPHPA